jgi:hypothetical protein
MIVVDAGDILRYAKGLTVAVSAVAYALGMGVVLN